MNIYDSALMLVAGWLLGMLSPFVTWELKRRRDLPNVRTMLKAELRRVSGQLQAIVEKKRSPGTGLPYQVSLGAHDLVKTHAKELTEILPAWMTLTVVLESMHGYRDHYLALARSEVLREQLGDATRRNFLAAADAALHGIAKIEPKLESRARVPMAGMLPFSFEHCPTPAMFPFSFANRLRAASKGRT